MNFKETVYLAFAQILKEKISQLLVTLKELSQSAANETKSTAGDKHETALAMLQIEQENKRKQLKEMQQQELLLNKINPSNISTAVLNGSLVQTDKGYFFISVALGRISIEGKTIFALSPSSPLGKKLLNQNIAGTVEMNGTHYTILSIE